MYQLLSTVSYYTNVSLKKVINIRMVKGRFGYVVFLKILKYIPVVQKILFRMKVFSFHYLTKYGKCYIDVLNTHSTFSKYFNILNKSNALLENIMTHCKQILPTTGN